MNELEQLKENLKRVGITSSNQILGFIRKQPAAQTAHLFFSVGFNKTKE